MAITSVDDGSLAIEITFVGFESTALEGDAADVGKFSISNFNAGGPG